MGLITQHSKQVIRKLRTLSFAVSCGIILISLSSQASAGTRPSFGWSFATPSVSVGAFPSATYQESGIKPGSLLVFERQFGSAKVWKPVATFASSPGGSSVNLPSDPIGAYAYRVIVKTGNKVLLQTSDHELYSYGPVSLAVICNEANGGNGQCRSGSVQLQNSFIYTYVFASSPRQGSPPGADELSFPNTSCRSGSLTITVGFSNFTQPGGSATIQIAQSASDPQTLTIADTSQQVFNFNLDHGPFIIDDWYTNGSSNVDGEQVWYSGNFDCYTPTGLR